MKRLVLALALGLCVAACRAPRERGPTFAVTTWDGETHAGPLAAADDAVTVGRRSVPREAVRLILQMKARASQAARVEGFEPLDKAQLARYRERAADAARKHRGAESILCLDQGQDSLMANDDRLYRYHALVLVLKDEGRKVADLTLGFREGRSRSRVLFARSIAPDGSVRWLEPATMKVATPSQGKQFLDTRRRMLSGRIPGVAVGSLVEYAYEYRNYNPEVPEHYFPSWFFSGEEPVLDSAVTIRVPRGKRLNWTTRNVPEAAREPERATDGELDVYRWVMRDRAPIDPEPQMPDRADVAAVVHCSLFFDWKALHERTGRFQRERIEVTPEIQQLAKQIVGDAKTDDDKLARIYHWTQRRISYMSIKGSLASGWTGHPASETLKNGYGDCTDKAIVLASLAKAVGIASYPAIIMTNDAADAVTDIPVPDGNHCISLVLPDGKPRFIDSTASNYRYPYSRDDDHGVKALVHITGQILDVPVPPPSDNLRVSRQEIALKPDGGAEGVDRNTYNGSYEARVRGFWRRVPPQVRGAYMQEYLQRRVPGALCTGFELGELDDLSKQLSMVIRYRVPRLATRTKDLYIVTLPGFARDFPDAALPSRRYPIERPTTEEFRNTVAIRCPDGYDLVGLPEPLTIHGKHLWHEGRVAAAPDRRSLTVTETFRRRTRAVPPADYSTYRAHAARIAAWTRLKLVFRKSPAASGRAAR